MENIHNHVNFILDEFAPFRKLNKHEIKLKSKPWINKETLFLMWERDKLFSKYHKCKNLMNKPNLFSQYKLIRNDVTKLKRDNKIKYYRNLFEANKKRHLQFGKESGPFTNVGPSIENKIPSSQYIYTDYLKDVRINHSFYLKPATYLEVAEIIQSLDINKSLGPNSLPVHIFKICEVFLSTCLLEIANLSFRT